MKIPSRTIALSAISCAIAATSLTVGALYSPLLFTGYIAASLAMMLPLSDGRVLAAFLAYVGAGLTALGCSGFDFWGLMPYFLFFGLHPIVNAIQKRWKVNAVLAVGIKALWFDAAAYLTWRFLFGMHTSIAFLDEYFLPLLLVFGSLFFIVYDYGVTRAQRAVNYAVDRTVKRGRQ